MLLVTSSAAGSIFVYGIIPFGKSEENFVPTNDQCCDNENFVVLNSLAVLKPI